MQIMSGESHSDNPERTNDSKGDPNNEYKENDDNDFVLTAEMMANDFDLQIESEDELGSIDHEQEIKELNEDQFLSVEELIAKYYSNPPVHSSIDKEKYYNAEESNNFNKENITYATNTLEPNNSYNDANNVDAILDSSRRPLRNNRNQNQVGEETFDTFWDKKEPNIGSNFQIEVNDFVFKRSKFEGTYDKEYLIWSPKLYSIELVDEYLEKIYGHMGNDMFVSYDEVLHHLHYNNGDIDKALRNIDNLKTNIDKRYITFDLKDIKKFEDGISNYGKNFVDINENLLPSKTYGQIINFYYDWKKSLRAEPFLKLMKKISSDKGKKSDAFDLISRYFDQELDFNSLPSYFNDEIINSEDNN